MMFEIFRDKDTTKEVCNCSCSCNCGCGCGTCFGDPVAMANNYPEVHDSDHEDFDYDAFFKLGRVDVTWEVKNVGDI